MARAVALLLCAVLVGVSFVGVIPEQPPHKGGGLPSTPKQQTPPTSAQVPSTGAQGFLPPPTPHDTHPTVSFEDLTAHPLDQNAVEMYRTLRRQAPDEQAFLTSLEHLGASENTATWPQPAAGASGTGSAPQFASIETNYAPKATKANAAAHAEYEEKNPACGFTPGEVTTVADLYISINGGRAHPIRLGLFSTTVPRTVENFREICTGEAGVSYNNTPIHRAVAGFLIQGGDFEHGDGTGGWSIYGRTFPDENFILKTFPFCVAMANTGPNSNGAQFFITVGDTKWLDEHYVVFGRVLSGHDIVQDISQLDADRDEKPDVPVEVTYCKIVSDENPLHSDPNFKEQFERNQFQFGTTPPCRDENGSLQPAPSPVGAPDSNVIPNQQLAEPPYLVYTPIRPTPSPTTW